MDDEVEVFGPDKGTSCASPGRRLELGISYLAGIGGACEAFEEWTALSVYSGEEVELLRSATEVCSVVAATTDYQPTNITTTNTAVTVIPTVISLLTIVFITAALN